MDKYLSYDDVLLIPRYSELESRELADTSVELCGYRFKSPVVPADMEDVINTSIAKFLSQNGYFYIYHRFGKNSDNYECLDLLSFIGLAHTENWKLISVSIGVNDDTYKLLNDILKVKFRVDFFCVEVAHGHSFKVRNMIRYLKTNFPNAKIIAGNIATYEAYRDLAEWGADVVKVGIGQGCFSGETKVLMANGTYKEISKINIGERVINKNGIPVKVINKINNGIKEVLKIKTNSWYEDTFVTPNHNFWIGDLSTTKITYNCINTGVSKQLDKKSKTTPKKSKYKWKHIKDFNTKNNFTLLPKKICFDVKDSFIIDLSVFLDKGKKDNDYIITNGNVKFNRHIKSGYDLGYIFGTFLGDGSSLLLNSKNGEIGRVGWTFHRNEKEIAEKLKKSIFSVFGIYPVIKKHTSPKNIIDVYFYNKCCAKLLSEFGKRESKLLPENLYSIDEEYINGLYDGLIDSDGTVGDKTSLSNTSKKIHELFYYLLLQKQKTFGSLENTRSSELVKSKNKSFRTTVHSSNRLTKDYSYGTINDIDNNIIEAETWDIEVDCPTHSFIANNNIVHNSICTTRFQTGFSIPMFSCVRNIFEEKRTELNLLRQCKAIWDSDKAHIELGKKAFNSIYGEYEKTVNENLDKISNDIQRIKNQKLIPIIADGGIKYIGDIAKSLVAGATMVMSGKLFASCLDSPAKIVDNKKQYRGSTSFAAKKHNKHIEGKVVDLEADITVKERLQEIKEALQSSISYAGGKDLNCFKNVGWIKI